MDQTVSLIQKKILQSRDNSDQFADIYYHAPLSAEDRDHKGAIIVHISLHKLFPVENKPVDLPKLCQELFIVIQEAYYHNNDTGSPLEALEHALQMAQEKAILQTEKSVQGLFGALAVWGKTMIYANPDNTFIGIRRNHEFIELDQDPYGNEVLKDDDLIILATSVLKNYHIEPLLRDKQELNNTDFAEEMTHVNSESLAEKDAPAVGYTVHIQIDRVPGDEEIIEIQLPPREDTVSNKKSPVDLMKFSKKNQTEKQDSKKHLDDPAIYLRPSKPKKKRTILFFLILLILLIASIYFSYRYNQQHEQQKQLEQTLEKGQQQLDRAQQLASLNPKESEALLDETTSLLGQVKGVKQDIDQKANALQDQAVEIRRSIYKTQEITPQLTDLSEGAAKRAYSMNSRTVINSLGTVTLQDSSEWQNPIEVDTYSENIYVLDPAASALWKYINVGGRYAAASNYFRQSPNIQGAIDVSIDGSVYVLYPDKLERYTLGVRDDFKLSGIYPDLSSTSRIAVEPDSKSLFISSNNRILVFGEDGRYQRLLVSDSLDVISDLISTDKGTALWIKDSHGWWKVNPSQK
ncbi:hypothetical protein HGA91_01455 [candidate division WWE3 bacterium]|nr:hypothetical protein [candidate division WWE3 bacterium]